MPATAILRRAPHKAATRNASRLRSSVKLPLEIRSTTTTRTTWERVGAAATTTTTTTTEIVRHSRFRGSAVVASATRFGAESLEVFPSSWADLAGVLSGRSGASAADGALGNLANKIGRDVYMDIGGWHLYLKDAKAGGVNLSVGVATLVMKKYFESGSSDEAKACEEALDEITVKLGGGKLNCMLSALVPRRCVEDLVSCVEDFIKDEM